MDFNSRLYPLWEQLGIESRCHVRSAGDLRFSDDSFDWTISTDFLEHVQETDRVRVINELFRVAPRGRHVIDLTPESAFRGPEGENLHPDALDAASWALLFTELRDKVPLDLELGPRHLLISWSPAVSP